MSAEPGERDPDSASAYAHDLTSSPHLTKVSQLDPAELRILEATGRHWAETVSPPGPESAQWADPARREVVETESGEFYVRKRLRADFAGGGPNPLRATLRAWEPKGRAGRIYATLKHFVLGDALTLPSYVHERLSKTRALAVLSSDAISSVSYATEQILLVLVVAGTGAFWLSLPIGACIAALMVIVGLSYRQTIHAYPKGGGSYLVARDNLGVLAGVTAAAALMTDYTLTVAVSIASGVSAVIATFPTLAPYRVPLGVGCILLIVLGNLRGTRAAGALFSLPTYTFILGMYAMIAAGFWLLFIGRAPIAAPPSVLMGSSLTTLLILKAFSNGCSALTGVEAISDGVPAFRPPEWKNARMTLTWMVAILVTIFAGVTALAHLYNIGPDPTGDKPLIARLSAAVFGAGPAFYFIQYATFRILILAANTSFSDFPRVLFFLARDGFAPRAFQGVGDRLAFSNGIIALAVVATVLFIAFGGQVAPLIPLYTIGVFASFTLSQFGMVRHWTERRRAGERNGKRWAAIPHWRARAAMNMLGACATLLVLLIAAVSKFTSGAWLILVMLPVLVAFLLAMRRHYDRAGRDMRVETPVAPTDIQHTVVCPVGDLNRPTLHALAYARSLSPHVIAVYISQDAEGLMRIQEKWRVWGEFVPLRVIESPYRGVVVPLLAYIDALRQSRPEATITVVLPEFVPEHWWQGVLHNQTALRLKRHLLFRPGVVVTNVPYHQQTRSHDRAPSKGAV